MTPAGTNGTWVRMTTQKYEGSCHCGKVKYTAELDLSQPVVVCNCSMCGRSGTMLAFIPRSAFELKSGREDLKSYKFNREVIDHVFCTTCGIKPFAYGTSPDGTETSAINVRCLEGVDTSSLTTYAYDGKNM
jgi:hypothetical protein